MRRNLRIFTFLFIFFIVVAVGSLVVLNGHGSVFNRTRDSLGAQTAVLTQTVIGEENTQEPEEAPEPEPETEPEPVPEQTEPESAAEIIDSEPVVEETESDVVEIEPVIEETEPEAEETEPVEEPQSEEASQEDTGVRYYTYTINTSVHSLRLRQDPNMDSRILVYMARGSKGYVLKMDSSWTKVHTENGMEGYCSTEYLDIKEVSREDFPEDIRDRVESTDGEAQSSESEG